MVSLIRNSDYGQLFYFEGGWSDPNNFFKQFFSGALITIVMTGLDQDMMQKNLSMPTFRDAQKNMAAFSIVLIFANLLAPAACSRHCFCPRVNSGCLLKCRQRPYCTDHFFLRRFSRYE